jgi:RHS repeat-associated protein
MTTSTVSTKEHIQSRSRSTGKERDSESGNDYFEARYYSSAMGRFMSPDWSAKEDPVPYANLDDPQSLNLYSYVGNNPLTRIDADGHVAGADDAVEVTVGVVILGALAAEAGVQYYNHTPEAQRSLDGALNAAKENFTSNVQSVKNTISGWFSKKTPPPASSESSEKGAEPPQLAAGKQAHKDDPAKSRKSRFLMVADEWTAITRKKAPFGKSSPTTLVKVSVLGSPLDRSRSVLK